MIRVRTTHLELRSPAALEPTTLVPSGVVLRRTLQPNPDLNCFLYTTVGAEYCWDDRLPWTRANWMGWVSRPEVQTWVLYQSDAPVGYFELEAQEGGSVEIVYFGLLPSFTGKGLGKYLLTQAIYRAFAMREGVTRVWVHTCTLDHPAGLAGYLAAGFTIFKEEDEDMDLPARPR